MEAVHYVGTSIAAIDDGPSRNGTIPPRGAWAAARTFHLNAQAWDRLLLSAGRAVVREGRGRQ